MPPGPEVEVPPYPEQTIPATENDAQQNISANSFWRDPRPTNKNPNFVKDYFQSSRLHFIGSFRARYESMMVAVGKRLNVHPSTLLRPPPKAKSTTERVIVHIDMDCFFASIAVTKNPELRGKCIAICHGGGEISSCSYEARAYGVRAGMFCRDARKLCPDLINVDYDFPSYEKVSIQIYSFFHDYPGICVEAVSVDEAYLDITETVGKDISQSNAETLVTNLRNRIQMETRCTASAGIGPSKLVARLATKGAKPNGQLRVRQENVIKYLDTLSASDLPGIGWRTSKRLAALNVTTVPQLRALSLNRLQEEFGERQGQIFHDLARALDSRPMEPLKPRKSIGAEASWGVRFEKDETHKVNKFIEDIVDEVSSRVTEAGAQGKKMTYKVYRRIPGSSMKGWKYLGHGPCTTLTKSAKLPADCVAEVFKATTKEKCLEIHRAWKIQNDEFRGVGLQITDLVFADLSFNYSTLPANGTRRIDAFFSAAQEREKVLPRERISCKDQPIQSTEKVADTAEDAGRRIANDNVRICAQEKLPIQTPKHEALIKTDPGKVEEDKIEPEPKPETSDGNQGARQMSTREAPLLSDLPEGWDIQVFKALPRELQTELLQGQNQVFAQNKGVNTTFHVSEANPVVSEPRQQTRPAKRRRDIRSNGQDFQQFETKRRKQAAQITMTQCADISELRKTGHKVLDAEEFRERPLREVVELLDDLKPHRRGVKLYSEAEALEERPGTNGKDEAGNSSGKTSTHKTDFDIPSPPSLSSDSESSYGVSGAVEKEGFGHPRIYVDEDVWTYASKLEAWMQSKASDIKTGHMELLRGRVLEMLYLKELDRACTELRVIRKYADEDRAGTRGWRHAFNELLVEVQNECVKLYGFRLSVKPLGATQRYPV